MSTATPAALRERCIAFLAAHQIAVLSLTDPDGPWAMPVSYATRELTVGCLLPRWAEIDFRLQRCRDVHLIAPDGVDARCWLSVRGHGRVVTSGWPGLLPVWSEPVSSEELHTLVEITPRRLDLVDERAGWGRRETLDL